MSRQQIYVSPLDREVNVSSNDVEVLLEAIRTLIPANYCESVDEYGYPNDLAKCVVDAIWSIGSKYWTHVVPLLQRFDSARHGLDREANTPTGYLESFSALLNDDGKAMADQVFVNHQRTSTKNGILKSSAVEQWLRILRRFGIERNADLVDRYTDTALQSELAAVKGDGEDGIRRDYLFMLAGRRDLLKWDRQLKKFFEHHLGRTPTRVEALGILTAVVARLRLQFPCLDVRGLDHIIWRTESGAETRNEFSKPQPTTPSRHTLGSI